MDCDGPASLSCIDYFTVTVWNDFKGQDYFQFAGPPDAVMVA